MRRRLDQFLNQFELRVLGAAFGELVNKEPDDKKKGLWIHFAYKLRQKIIRVNNDELMLISDIVNRSLEAAERVGAKLGDDAVEQKYRLGILLDAYKSIKEKVSNGSRIQEGQVGGDSEHETGEVGKA